MSSVHVFVKSKPYRMTDVGDFSFLPVILRCVIFVVLRSTIQSCSAYVCIYLYMHTVMNTILLQLVSIYKIVSYILILIVILLCS